MKHTMNMTERAARAEVLLERAMQCIETTHRHHACAGCTDEVRALRAIYAEQLADLDTLALNARPAAHSATCRHRATGLNASCDCGLHNQQLGAN